MKVEMWTLDRVKPYDKNPRLNDDAVDSVVNSIEQFGFRQPIVVDTDGIIIVGHTRFKAAQKMGLTKVPIHVAKDLSADAIKAYRIADNKTGELAEWDYYLLPIELQQLGDAGYDFGLLGFDQEELAKLLGSEIQEGLTDPDDVPEPPDDPITQPGDLWILGNHRLLCGDSSKPEDLQRLLNGAVIDLVNSDPPYNVKVEPRSNNAIAAGNSSFQAKGGRRKAEGSSEQTCESSGLQPTASGLKNHQKFDLERHPGKAKPTQKKMRAKDRPLANDFVTDDAFDVMLHAWFHNMSSALKPGGSFYIWGGYANLGNYPGPLKAAGFYFSQGIIWDKCHPVLTRKDYMGAFEICFYGWKEGAGHKYHGPNNETDLWHVKKIPPQQLEHLTGKPAALAVRAIQNSSLPGDNVLDLFGGSGSTMIGAEQTGRKAFLMELDAPYCDVIVDRFQRFTGIPAILERTGESPIPMKAREENMR